jgi:hypothetical protein
MSISPFLRLLGQLRFVALLQFWTEYAETCIDHGSKDGHRIPERGGDDG